MKKQSQPFSLREVVERVTEELTEALSAEVERRVAEALRSVKLEAGSSKVDGRRGGRLCPVPGCGKPGAGPRNRWFCKDHAHSISVTEQRSILARNKRLADEGRLNAAVPSDLIVRLPPKNKRSGRALDMSCRVEGCPNRSGGPRSGFICELHRSQLTPDEQKQAREAHKARRQGAVAEPARPAAPKLAQPVPPIVRKAASET